MFGVPCRQHAGRPSSAKSSPDWVSNFGFAFRLPLVREPSLTRVKCCRLLLPWCDSASVSAALSQKPGVNAGANVNAAL